MVHRATLRSNADSEVYTEKSYVPSLMIPEQSNPLLTSYGENMHCLLGMHARLTRAGPHARGEANVLGDLQNIKNNSTLLARLSASLHVVSQIEDIS